MTITPVDIQEKEFERAFRGYDMEDVDDFLDHIAKDLEELIAENIRLQEEVELLKSKNKSYQQMEDTMQSAIVVAQRAADELKQKTAKEAAAVKALAANEARQLIEAARNRSSGIVLEHESLVRQLKGFKERFRSFIEVQLKTIDSEELFDELPGEPAAPAKLADNVFEFEPTVQYKAEGEAEAKEETEGLAETAPEEEPLSEADLDDLDLDYGLERDLDQDPDF